MNSERSIYFALLSGLLLFACSCNHHEEQQKAEKAAEQQVLSDEEKIDSMNKAIMEQMESVPDDSVLKSVDH